MGIKLRTLIVILIAPLINIIGQNTFFKSYGGSGNDYGESVISCKDSGFCVVGGTESYGHGLMDLYIVKTNKTGDFQWHKTFGGPGIDLGKEIIQTNDSNFIACGYSNSLNLNYSIYLVKIDQLGNEIWTKRFGGNDWDFGYKIIESKADPNNYFITGKTYSYGAGNSDAFLMKINNQGDSLWMKTYGSSGNDVFNDIIEDENGNLYTIGSVSNSSNIDLLWISKLNSQGDTIWNYTDEYTNTIGKSITMISDKLIYCGKKDTTLSSTPQSNFLCGILDTNGQKFSDIFFYYHSFYNESCVKVIQKPNSNNYHLVANYYEFGENKVLYAELNNQILISGQLYIRGNGNDYVNNADTIKNENGFIAVGTTEETINGYKDIFLSKTSNGVWDSTFNNNLLLNSKEINPNQELFYPNPATNYMYFYGLKKGSVVSICDLKGIVIDRFVINSKYYNTRFLKPGIYIVNVLRSDGRKNSSKLMKL